MKSLFRHSALCCAVLMSSAVVASETPGTITTQSGVDLLPVLSSIIRYDDNIASASSSEKSSAILVLTPSLNAKLLDGANEYTMFAAISSGTYFSSTDDNFLDATLSGNGKLELNQSNRINISGQYVFGHEDRGTGLSEGLGNNQDEPTKFNTFNFSGYYEYGALSTPARIRVSGGVFDKEYTNYEDVSKYKNFTTNSVATTFYYDTGAYTSVVAEASLEDTSYEFTDLTAARDSQTKNYRVGAEWQATAATSGSIRVGLQQKDFDSAARQDFSGVAWSAAVTWQPLSYSTLQLSTGRKAKDPNTVGDYIKETTYGVNWSHTWSEFISSDFGVNFVDEVYTGIDRSDQLWAYRAAFSYVVTSWLSLTGGVEFTDKSSTVDTIKFDKTVTFVGFNFTL